MVARFLVTTALEDTWPAEDVPVLFLGEWCRNYDRKSAWEHLDAVVAPYHWDDRKKLYGDYLYLQQLYEKVLVELSARLNELHRVDHSLRYWRVLVGPWLGCFIQMLFDRWSMLTKTLEEYEISDICLLESVDEALIPNDMAAFSTFFVSDYWNEYIFSELFEHLGTVANKIRIRYASAQDAVKYIPQSAPRANYLRRGISLIYETLTRIGKKNDDFFVFGSYLPTAQELILQLKLKQIPRRWSYRSPPRCSIEHEKRSFNLHFGGDTEFEYLLSKLAPRNIPIAYLEGYQKLISMTEACSWPKTPKGIFTSCLHFTDDFFKAWAAEKIDRGSKLVIGQHGGNYGMALWNFYEDHQVAIADRFLSWGWTPEGSSNIKPIGNFKRFGVKRINADPVGKALLVEMTMPRYSYHMYSVPVAIKQYLAYFEDQCRFVNALPCELQDQLLVRLYPEDYGVSQLNRWRDCFPQIQIENGVKPMTELLLQTRVYISTYNATTYLETLASNFPTIIFWNPEHWEIRKCAWTYFEDMKSVGIFHANPESAALHMAKVWDDVSGWWQSPSVQAVRRLFCERFSRIPEKPLQLMTHAIHEISRQ